MRRLLSAAVASWLLCSCADAIPPREPPTPPTPPTPEVPGYVPPSYGVCQRLHLPELVPAIGRPDRVTEEQGDLGETDRTCRLPIHRGRHRPVGLVTVRIVIDGPYARDRSEVNGWPYMMRTDEPISGWWSQGTRQVSRMLGRPLDASRVVVSTEVQDRDLWVYIGVHNPRVDGWAELQATTRLGDVVLDRLADELSLEAAP